MGISSFSACGRKAFFFEKKKQKTFDYFGFGLSRIGSAQFAKVFWFFFSKKNCFLRVSKRASSVETPALRWSVSACAQGDNRV
jgi:hypothetical protein